MHCCEHDNDQDSVKKPVESTDKAGQVYTCPMHPEVRRDHPGMCPECGMNLVPAKAGHAKHDDHDKHAGHKTESFLRKFVISLVLTIPVVLYSEITPEVFGWEPSAFFGSQYLPFIFGTIVFFYCGWIFLASAYRELRARVPGMMTLIALAISAAYFYSIFATLSQVGHTLFWELTTLITIMLLGHWIEMRAVKGAKGALKELTKLLPDTAEVLRGGETETISLSELKEGDIVLVKPGAKIPADGMIIGGQSDVNEAMVTGESKPVAKQQGSEVIAGTINGDGSLKIKVTKIGEHTFLAGIMRLVSEAEASKSKLQMLSDRAAFYLTIIAIVTGGATFVAWLLADAGIVFATERLVAVLVIACPHALGLAIPLVASISTTLAARNGLLIKRRMALEMARNIDMALFDKTGTLTKGEYGVADIFHSKAQDDDAVLRLAAAIESHSEHPVAQAIVGEAKKRSIAVLEVKNFERIPGKGIKGSADGGEIFAGGEAILEVAEVVVPEELKSRVAELSKQGKTIVYIIRNKELAGVIALADIIREESREAVAALKKEGVKVAMITGDSEDVAQWVARELGIDEYFARVLPGEKADKVKLLQNKGLKVAMVGDGVNDAPALTQADLGIAIGAGTNVAIESAGIILVRNDPRDIPRIIKLSRATYKKMIQNLFWATGYNVVALPLAAGVLASQGILLQPAVAALFMSLSTVIVAVNAVFLRRAVL